MNLRHGFGAFCVTIGFAVLIAGCSQKENDDGKQVAKKKNGEPAKKHELGGWWCAEHGVPEDRCSLCLPPEKVDELFKSKGDWCEIHDRAKSQCFKCNPKLYKRFAAMYRAKEGKDPPRPPESEFQK